MVDEKKSNKSWKEKVNLFLTRIFRKEVKAVMGRTEYDDLVAEFDSKYPRKFLFYAGTEIDLRGPDKRLYVNVCDYIHVTQSMRDWIADKNLKFDKPVDVNSVWEHVWKVYSEFTKHTRYILDKDLYGVNEQWLPNMSQFYMVNRGKWLGDCENFALLCAGLIEASGVPRGLYRVTAGDTKLGGHATLTAYNPEEGDWVHLETTATKPRIIKEGEDIYIHNVWFSFDSRMAFTNKRIKNIEVKR